MKSLLVKWLFANFTDLRTLQRTQGKPKYCAAVVVMRRIETGDLKTLEPPRMNRTEL